MAQMLYQGHGSYRFTLDDGTVVYVDPFAGDEYNVPADLILVTHEHFDHNQVQKMPHAPGCSIIRARDVHPSRAEYLTVESHGVRIIAVQACNKNHPVEECVGMVLEFDGVTFYASGDTSTTDDMKSGKLADMGIDYAVFPGDGFYNMDVEEASACAALVSARHSIPVHLVPVDNPNDATQLFSRERAEAFHAAGRIILEPGETISLEPNRLEKELDMEEATVFRGMRRHKQQLSDEEVRDVLTRGKTGILAVIGDGGYPYTVPINYVYASGNIYMHSALTGHKIDAIRNNDKASFCVIDADDVVPSDYSTNFRSVIAFGRVHIIEDETAKEATLRLLGDKYNPNQPEALNREVAKSFKRLHMIELEIEHVTGKQSKELAHVKGPLDE